jgi:quercetin dioxygenase-like cupin family protein
MRADRARSTRLASIPTPLRVLALVAIVSLGTTGVAIATTGTGISTNIISVGALSDLRLKSDIDGHKVDITTKGASDLYVVDNVIAPGGSTGWHSHPGPSLITVKSGTITEYHSDDPSCTPTVYTAGQTFVDAGGDHEHILRNEGSVPAETIAVQIVASGAPRRIDLPAPGNCPF